MADQDIMHTAEIMKAALPYIDAPNKVMVEFFMKAIDLMGYAKTLKNSLGLAACGYEAGKLDMEGLLNNIRPVCNKKERDIIDKILNIFNMKRAFEMYKTMIDAMNVMQEFGDFSFGSSSNNESKSSDMGAANYDNSNLNNDSKQSFEDTIRNLSDIISSNYADNASNKYEENSSNHDKYASDSYSDSTADSNDDNTSNNYSNNTSDSNFDDTTDFFSNNSKSTDNIKSENNSSTSSGMMNDKMLNMLKAMVPEEQRATFENLSMLLNTMSYDNNSKPDESKEHNNG